MGRFLSGLVFLALASAVAPAQVVRRSETEVDETTVERIEPAAIRPEAGSCFMAVLRRGRPGDAESGGGSACVLMEDGKPLGPAHAVHADIRARGRGAYSHWTAAVLYFSASDNSDPRTNGRSYALVSRSRVLRRTAVVTVTAPSGSYAIESPGKAAVNRRLTLRNLDSRVGVTPDLREHGAPDLRSKEGMIRSLLEPGMTPERKSIAVWKFLVDRSYHFWPARDDAEMHDPVKFLNVYGYGFCDDAAENFAALAEAAGLKARVWGLNGHVVAESFYDGAWHMFDPDMRCYFRGADGRILGVEALAKDPSPITATPHTPSGCPTAEVAKFYTTTADNGAWSRGDAGPGHRLDPVLQPGDELTFDLAPARLVHNVFARDAPLPPTAANGSLRRRVSIPPGGAEFVIPIEWPYVLLGGELAVDGPAAPEVRIGDADAGWTPLASRADGASWRADFTPWFVARKDARYHASLRVRGATGAATLLVVFQFAPLAVPAVRPGRTTFDVAIAPAGGSFPLDWKGIEIVHEWDEPRGPAK